MQTYTPIQNPLVPYQFPEIKNIIKSIYDLPTYYNRYEIMDNYRTEMLNWLQNGTKTKILGLERFKYCYVINGVSQYINDLPKIENRKINLHCHEYSAYKKLLEINNYNFTEFFDYSSLQENQNELTVISYPCSLNGSQSTEVEEFLKNFNGKITLDSVFLGTNLFPINLNFNELKNVETFLFSFSKAFSLTYSRIGIMFTDKYIKEYDIYHEHCYLNLNACQLARQIIKNYNIDYFSDKYEYLQKLACEIVGCQTSDCLLIGLNDSHEADKKVKITHLFDDLIC